jgi:protein kinase A
MAIYKQILNGQIRWPSEFGPATRSIIAELLQANKSRRLGASHAGARAVKEHPYFMGINWDAVQRKLIEPPWRPPVSADPTIAPTHSFPTEDMVVDEQEGFTAPDPSAARAQRDADPEFTSLMRTAFVNF